MLQPLRGLRTPHRPIVSLCFSGRLIFRLRTETFFQKVPVFRMAYFAIPHHRPYGRRCSAGLIGSAKRSGFSRFAASIRAHCAFSSKTFMLQVRFAHPPNPAPSYRLFVLFRSAYFPSPHRTGSSSCSGVSLGLFGKPKRSTSSCFAASIEAHCAVSSETLMLQVHFAHPPNPAPSYRFFSISRRSGLRGCRHRAESTHHLTPSGCVPSGGAVAPPAPPLPPPSRCRPDRFKGSP